jgi:hypothetical protein
MSKKVHFYHGCPWASGDIQMADTNQQYSWDGVTCFKCWDNKLPDGSSSNWNQQDRERFAQTVQFALEQNDLV